MKKILWAFLFNILCLGTFAQQDFDILIINGRILDGTGNSWYYGDLGIRDGKIAEIGRLQGRTSARTIDASNKIVSPGFIDVHTHIEGDERRNPTADNFIYDGVTTVITGNCGESALNIGAYLSMIDSLQPSVNVASLVGHNTIRQGVMGNANRSATPEEQLKMESLVEEAMKAGAVGLSTGLIYIPGTYAPSEEIIQLAKVASKYNGLYATHMRSEGDSVLPAIHEALRIGREAEIPVQISHFKVGGQPRAGRSVHTLKAVMDAREEGIDVTIDQYPYTASSTTLSSLIPSYILADGRDSVRSRLADPSIRKKAIEEMVARLRKRGLKHFNYAVVTNFRADTTFNGKSIEEINRLRGKKHKAKKEAETILDMMIEGGAGMVFHGMWEEDVRRIMQYPYNMVASDASIRIFGQGVPHPRGYGSNAKVLSEYVRDEKIITLEEAVRRMTSLPASKFKLEKRGLLLPGYYADILVFDPGAVKDHSTFTLPHAYSTGFDTIIVNGKEVVKDGKHLGTRNGKTIRNINSRQHLQN